MEKQALVKLIQNTNGKFFGVTFIKRTTGKSRNLNGRLGVKRYVKGVGLAFIPQEKGLIVVYDLKKRGYRMIPEEGIISLRFQKQEMIAE